MSLDELDDVKPKTVVWDDYDENIPVVTDRTTS